MAYQMKHSDKSVEQAVRRIAVAQLDQAIALLESPGQPDEAAIHSVRKHIKRLRGLIRLVQPGFSAFERENAALRDAADCIAPLRDGDVMQKTLATLGPVPHTYPAFSGAISQLGRAGRSAEQDAADIAACAAILPDIRDRALGWKVRPRGFGAARKGLRQTFEAVQDKMAATLRRPTGRRVHDWRKRVKDHLYQVQLIEPVLPEALGTRAKDTDELAELLGQHHDLTVMREHAEQLALPHAEAARLAAAIAARQESLLSRALPLGARLFSADAREVTDGWADRWTAWHDAAPVKATRAVPLGSV
jgi:CHAD domain-containing protein